MNSSPTAQNKSISLESLLQAFNGKAYLPVVKNNTYFRSRIFTAQSGINPLIAAAQPLLSFIEHSKKVDNVPDPDHLHAQLIYELQAFETYAHAFSYTQDTIKLARYLIGASLDEVILKAKWPAGIQKPKKYFILTEHQYYAHNGFFILLEKLIESPENNIDLLELVYLCISSGFMGKHKQARKGKEKIEALLEKLYQTIKQHRDELQDNLFIKETQLTQKITHKKSRLSTGLILVFALLLIGVFYASLSYVLHLHADSLNQQLQNMSRELPQFSKDVY